MRALRWHHCFERIFASGNASVSEEMLTSRFSKLSTHGYDNGC